MHNTMEEKVMALYEEAKESIANSVLSGKIKETDLSGLAPDEQSLLIELDAYGDTLKSKRINRKNKKKLIKEHYELLAEICIDNRSS